MKRARMVGAGHGAAGHPCEGYWKLKRCRRKAEFRHVTETGEHGGFSYVVRLDLCERCSEQMDTLRQGPVRPGLMREKVTPGVAQCYWCHRFGVKRATKKSTFASSVETKHPNSSRAPTSPKSAPKQF